MPHRKTMLGILGKWKTGFSIGMGGFVFSITAQQAEIYLRVGVLFASFVLTVFSIWLKWREIRASKNDPPWKR